MKGSLSTPVSVVIETWNVDGEVGPLSRLLAQLEPQLGRAQLVVTHVGIPEATRVAIAGEREVAWVEMAREATYYDHKNNGFDAATGDIVAFIDGDCTPEPDWLAAITAPFSRGARVVAGATSYPGAVAGIANDIDFPYFDGKTAERRSIGDAPETVRNFFANNVAFERSTFDQRRYPTIEPMFHGQCQVLALQLLNEGIPVVFASNARCTHAWPAGVREWLEVRLLRGADTVALMPYLLAKYAPRAAPTMNRLGPLPTLALFGARAIGSIAAAVRRGPLLRGLGFVALATVVDSIGAAASPRVYRLLGV